MRVKLKSAQKANRYCAPPLCSFDTGGGSSPAPAAPTNQTVTQTNLPAYLEPYVTRNVASAEAAAGTPYQAYEGQRLAGFNPNQQQTQAGIMGLQTPGQYGQAAQTTQGLMGSSWTDPGMAAQFMDPYQQNVTDIAKREAARQSNIQGTYDASKFGSAGAFGGYRQGVVDSERERNLSQQQADIQAQGSNQAYQQGVQQYNTQNQMHLGAAQQLAGLGGQQQAADLARLGAQTTTGQQQQQLTQQQLTQQYQDFLTQRDYPKEQVNWMSGILHGTPMPATPSSQQASYQAAPNAASQLAGLGIAGLGAYKTIGG